MRRPRTPKALRARYRGRILAYPYPVLSVNKAVVTARPKEKAEGSGERARVASEFQIRSYIFGYVAALKNDAIQRRGARFAEWARHTI
jgi:hypothetical protein